MKIYHYNRFTGEFIVDGNASENPLEEGKFLIPAHATLKAVPADQIGKVWLFVNDDWKLYEDYRERTICEKDTDDFFVSEYKPDLGEVLGSQYVEIEIPGPSIPKPKLISGSWADGRTPEEIEADRVAEVNNQLATTDADMSRVVEDLIALLESKGVMTEAELPQSAKDKLENRRNLRNQLRD